MTSISIYEELAPREITSNHKKLEKQAKNMNQWFYTGYPCDLQKEETKWSEFKNWPNTLPGGSF